MWKSVSVEFAHLAKSKMKIISRVGYSNSILRDSADFINLTLKEKQLFRRQISERNTK